MMRKRWNMRDIVLGVICCTVLFSNLHLDVQEETIGLRLASNSAIASDVNDVLALSEEEQAYVKEKGTVTVALSPDNYPYSTMETGEMTGVFPEMLSLFSYKSGLQVEIIPCETYEEYTKIKSEKLADVIFATHVDEEEAAGYGYQLTSSYTRIPYSKIELRDGANSDNKVAVLKEPSAEASQAANYYYKDQIIFCDSMEECLELLTDEKCESIIANSYAAEHIQYSDIKNQYIAKELYNNGVNIAAGVRDDENPILLRILERTLQDIDDITEEEIINRNSQKEEGENTVTQIIYTNPELCLGVVIAFVILIIGAFLLYLRVKRARAEVNNAEQSRRFMGYVCTAVDAVTELNVKARTMRRYKMEEDVLIEESANYLDDEWIMFHEDDREEIRRTLTEQALWDLCINEKTYYKECKMRWGDSSEYRWCNCTLRGMKPTDEKPFNLMLFIKDTQEIKENEVKQRQALEDAFAMAKQASQAKGTFLSKMSHEIRTPLNAVIGYLSIAKDEEGDAEKVRHCIDNSETAAKHLLSIINDVLDISSIESGKMKIAEESFDLKKSITDLSTIFFQNAKAKGVRFEANIGGLTEEWVMGDSLRLNQILMNLLSNAVKFTPEKGMVTLKIEQLNQDEKEVYIRFIVKDSGIGMSEEYMQHIFTPFEQESASTAKQFGGTGLGLSITQNLVDMMGGTIEVASKQGEGSSFSVTMHFKKCVEQRQEKVLSGDYSYIRALIVDDQKDEGQYVKMMLKRCGVKSDAVISGSKALKRLESRRGTEYAYDLCILDWNMPEMNGVETAAKIREMFGDDIPIIIATAYDITEISDEAKRLHVDKVVTKPLFQSTLFDLLVSTFGKYDPETEVAEVEKKRDMTGVRVLLAEDNEMNMDIAITVLQKAGIQVDPVEDGQKAYEQFLSMPEGTYDLILMDIQMPIMNGYEATKAIRTSSHPEARKIPIVAMTANAFAEDVSEALAKGMNAHISKPINYDKLFEVVNEFSK